MSAITDMISIFESISSTLGVDPTTLIGNPSKEVIINCLVNQMKRNAGVSDDDIEKITELKEQAEKMVNDPDSGKKLVEDMKNKLKDAASGVTNSYNNIKKMPSEVASTVTEGVSNLSSISANPITLNCLPSATLSFIQSLNSIQTQLTSIVSSAVNNLKILDDLGLSDLASKIDISSLEDDVKNITESISKGKSSCPSGISFDYYYKDSSHDITANSNVFSTIDQIPLYNSSPIVYNLKSCSSSLFDSSESWHTTSDIKTLCLYYDSNNIDSNPNFIPKEKFGIITSSDINSNYNRLRMYVDRTTDEISTKILGTRINIGEYYIAGFDTSSSGRSINFKLKLDSTTYEDQVYELYYYTYRATIISNYKRYILILPKGDIQLSTISGKSFKLYINDCYTGIKLTYDGNYISINSSEIKLLSCSNISSEYNMGVRVISRNSSGSYTTAKLTYKLSNNYASSITDLNKIDNISLYKENNIVSNEITNINISVSKTENISTGNFNDLILNTSSLSNNITSNINSSSFNHNIGQYIKDESTIEYNKYKIEISHNYENGYIIPKGYMPTIYQLKSIFITDVLTINYKVIKVESHDKEGTVISVDYYWKYVSSSSSNNILKYSSSDSDGIKVSFNVGSSNYLDNNISYTLNNFDVKCSGVWDHNHYYSNSDTNVKERIYDGKSTDYTMYNKYQINYFTETYNLTMYPRITTMYLEYLGDDISKVDDNIYKDGVSTNMRIYYDSTSRQLKIE